MFKVFVNDGTKEIPKDDIVYIVCKEGVYLKKKTGIMESITPVDGLSHLQPVESMAQMHIEKMPGYMFARVIDFFRKVYEEHRSEAVVLLFYDMENDEYEMVVPVQKVNASYISEYQRGISVEGMDMIGTIHSHAGMSAFHSGVDDKDEKKFDGLHITIGNLNDEDVSISASIVSNGSRFIVDPEEYINDITKVLDIDEEVAKPYGKVFKFVNGKYVESTSKHTYMTKKYDKRYASKFLKRSKEVQGLHDPEWMENVEYKAYVYKTGYSGWGGNFQSAFWKNKGIQNAFTNSNKQKQLPLKTETKETKTKDIPVAGEMNPCMECVFRAHKIDWVMEQISSGVKFDDGPEINNFIPDENFGTEDMFTDTYHCEKCDSVFQSEDLDCVCPVCKTDEHLVDVTGNVDLDDEEILDADFSAADEAGVDDTIKNTCLECGHTFGYKLGDTNCPHCGVPIPKIGEESIYNQFRADSGEFLDSDFQKVMDAANEADNEKRLPIPGQDETPIDKPGVFSFMRLSRKRNKKRKKK